MRFDEQTRDREWVSITECAVRLDISEDQVVELVRSGALNWTPAYGRPMVEPAVVNYAPT